MTFEEALIEHCSPTLAGIKAASLYRFSPQNARQFAQQYRAWQLLFAKRGLDLLILKG